MSTYLVDKAKCHQLFKTVGGSDFRVACGLTYVHEFVIAVFAFFLLFLCQQLDCNAAEIAPPPLLDHCHLEVKRAQVIGASLEYDIQAATKSGIKEWLVYACVPPDLLRQRIKSAQMGVLGSKITAAKTTEFSMQKRDVFVLRVSGMTPSKKFAKSLPVTAHFATVLFKSKLVRGPSRNVRSEPSKSEQSNNLTTSYSLDFNSSVFQRWLTLKKLRRYPDESDLQFAFRTFLFIKSKYSYFWDHDLDRRVSKTCLTKSSDCGGLSYLFCGILRANGVPARPLIGRWARSTDTMENDSSYFNCHVKSEFYAAGVGWVPVDISEFIGHLNSNPFSYFGNDEGDFIVMHVDTDLVLPDIGKCKDIIRSLPDFRVWALANSSDVVSNFHRQIHWRVVSIKKRKTSRSRRFS